MRFSASILAAALFISMGLSQTAKKPAADAGNIGMCTYYATTHNGHATASGEKFDSQALTAAHRKFPLGTKLKLTNLANEKSVVVRVNDRGPYAKGRDISVTRRAAQELGFVKQGVAKVRIEPVQ